VEDVEKSFKQSQQLQDLPAKGGGDIEAQQARSIK